ncbi:MAG: hypothetical protein A3H97_14110 [Acidobacteria bacterium RIFCSPLOWO2_02_FULL_65_29]|nr:MAG: hypothetical protein A3H97_14110 [Acidobacteria bacterium RIFCSPLOWO2_02_FULL_65_29]
MAEALGHNKERFTRLNSEGVPAPRGPVWRPSTIRGYQKTGVGILNNELYIGRLVHGRREYRRNPKNGRRGKAIENPASALKVKDVSHLRIVDDELWQAVKLPGRQRRMSATAGLNARFFVGRQDVVVRRHRFALAEAGIQIEDGTRCRCKVGVAREQPTAMAPRPDRIGGEPAPHGRAADRGDDPARDELRAATPAMTSEPAGRRPCGDFRTRGV